MPTGVVSLLASGSSADHRDVGIGVHSASSGDCGAFAMRRSSATAGSTRSSWVFKGRLTDEKHRPEMTIVAEPMSEEAVVDHTKQALANEDVVLRALRDQPERSWGVKRSWLFMQDTGRISRCMAHARLW
jgi:hypothetical protein